MKTAYLDLTGNKFGKLTAVQFLCRMNLHSMWKCVCDCGNETIVSLNNLRRNHTTSCGCASSRHKIGQKTSTHGLRNHPLYGTWTSMRNRCYWSKSNRSKHYRLRGIIVCPEWKDSFKEFHDWAIANGWKKELQLDRIDNNGNYEPSNCRWATVKEQARNRTSNVWIEIDGVTKIAIEWAEDYNMSPATIHNRMRKGWSGRDAVLTPLQTRKNKFVDLKK